MAAGNLYTFDDVGGLSEMRPSAPQNEDQLQELIAKYPAVIADTDGELLLIRREQPIGDGDTIARWSLDNLYVTKSAIPVLVEVKRAVDTRLRREVVGQMLDYAANGTAYWESGTIALQFAESCVGDGNDPDETISKFLGDDADPQDFWEQVDSNFAAGRMKLVFVADQIPTELARIVEFLDEQMRADVRAVELRWFESTDGTLALHPRVLGASERAKMSKSRARSTKPVIGTEEWIAETDLSENAREAAPKFIELIERSGGRTAVTVSQAAIMAETGYKNPVYPISFRKDRRGSIQIHFAYLARTKLYASKDAREQLFNRLVDIVGPLFSNNLTGHPGFQADALNDVDVQDRLGELLSEMFAQLNNSD